MAPTLEPTLLANLFFCAVIVILGLIAWRRTKKVSPLYVTGAFLHFGISHFATIIGVAVVLAVPLLVLEDDRVHPRHRDAVPLLRAGGK